MTEVLITDREDLRPGDVLLVWPQGSPEQWAEGPIHESGWRGLVVGGLTIRWGDGEWTTNCFDLTAHPARRTVPDLPTERGSVVIVTALFGERLNEPTPAMFDNDDRWFVVGYGWFRADEVTGWVPLAVTEAGPEVTR